jgi:hypothetical protein
VEADRPARQWDLDALRGLFLLLMLVTHVPTRLGGILGQPFGFVSAAEGFVMLSAFMAGLVYGGRALREGDLAMRQALRRRALKVYLSHVALLVFAFGVIARVGVARHEPAVTNLLSFYLAHPAAALTSASLLLHNPALLDILPMYILFMLLSPPLLAHGRHHGWGAIVAASAALWFAAQCGAGPALYAWVDAWVPLPIPHRDMGAFSLLAWQFIWVLGLWMGAVRALPDRPRRALPSWMVTVAVIFAGICFTWRHAVGQEPFPGLVSLNRLFDKFELGPLRLANFVALVLLLREFGPWLRQHLPRIAPLEWLGRASLPVFCAHVVMALTALALFGLPQAQQPWWLDALVFGTALAAVLSVALLSGAVNEWQRTLRAAGADRSAPSTTHNRPR